MRLYKFIRPTYSQPHLILYYFYDPDSQTIAHDSGVVRKGNCTKELEVQFLSSNSSELAERMWKEELVELLSRAHADVGLMWGRMDLSEREKLAIVADMCKVLCATPST
jgi:hypothetical protein